MPDTQKHLLIVEDEAPLREAIAEQLSDRGYRVEQAESGEVAIAKLADFAFDIIITDLRLPGIDGSAVVEAAVERYPHIIAIVVTGYGTVKDAVEAIKRGASDFVNKPFQIDELLHVLDSALEQRRLKSESAYLRAQLEGATASRHRRQSRPMKLLFQLLETVAATNSTILITGETGTGKKSWPRRSTTTARGGAPVHRAELQRDSRTLLEAELFGRVRGAFTGAVGNRQGRLEQAHRGTLFLDEVGTMNAALQISCCACCRSASSSGRRFAHHQGRRPRHRRDQQRPGTARRRRTVPRGSLLPAERDPRATAAAARPEGGRAAARAAFPRQIQHERTAGEGDGPATARAVPGQKRRRRRPSRRKRCGG
jgi:DNA-binding response OmpR family regulator